MDEAEAVPATKVGHRASQGTNLDICVFNHYLREKKSLNGRSKWRSKLAPKLFSWLDSANFGTHFLSTCIPSSYPPTSPAKPKNFHLTLLQSLQRQELPGTASEIKERTWVGSILGNGRPTSVIYLGSTHLRVADSSGKEMEEKGAWREPIFPKFKQVTVGYHRAVLLAKYVE
ncbi:hypothetical protein HAX54_016720 [Datura stramonium]|uniref:Protein kinase A anchor protein nuclear localisation signal domain-containing protein n=1 Tax=Datura stramonium TaxID=4076 RepID=A0ABS8UKM9_DATST|nr:hypothetical protein [Datura stramonium]